MTTTELGACEWFVWDLRRSSLIDRAQLDHVVADFLKRNVRAEPPALANCLVEQGLLTPFQAERLLQGKSQGLVLGPYTLVDSLGSGSMGAVYKAVSKNDGELYAVKVLPRRSMWNVRIARRQVRAFESVDHPAVVPFMDVGTAGGAHYLAWPYVEGETLDHVVERTGPLPTGTAALYAMQAAEGLEACHRAEIVHGMVKPSNLMLGFDGQVRVLDFGIGAILSSGEGESLVDTMSTANSLTSGLDCASPEAIIDPTQRTAAGDQYSLGCTLYYCLTGQYPFPDGTAVQKMMWHQAKDPVPVQELNAGIPEGLAAVVERLMQKVPEARYADMMELVQALEPFAAEAAPPPPRPAPPARPVARAPQSVPVFKPEPVLSNAWDNVPVTDTLRAGPGLTPSPVRAPAVLERPRSAVSGQRPLPPRTPVLRSGQLERGRTLEERLGPVGVLVLAVLAACVTWMISLWLFR